MKKTAKTAAYVCLGLVSVLASLSDVLAGAIVYRTPYVDSHYGAIPGVAGDIAAATINNQAPATVLVKDDSGVVVSISFFTQHAAKNFQKLLVAGASLDVTRCAQPGRFVSKEPSGPNCVDKIFEAVFDCGVLDSVTILGNPIDETHFIGSGLSQSTVYTHRRECFAGF